MRLEHFQLIDRIAALSLENRTIRAEATVPTESTIFEGHFPGYPILPGVLMIETMAQAAGWLAIAATNFEFMVFLAQVKGAKFRHFVNPGELLQASATLLHIGSGYAVAETLLERDGQAVADAELRFRVTPFPEERLRDYMREMAQRVALSPEARVNG